jgi:hypothetical protein
MSAIPLNIKDYIENSKIELYLYDSLPFNVKEHNEGREFNKIESDKNYRASIFLDTIKNSGKTFELKGKDIKANQLKGFSSFKEIREFIADNYDEHSELIDTAMRYELSRLKSVLYGYSLDLLDVHSTTRKISKGMQINVNSANDIKLSNNLFRDAKNIFLSYDKADNTGRYKTIYKEFELQSIYSITPYLVSLSDEFDKRTQTLNFGNHREKELWFHSLQQDKLVKEMLNNVAIIVTTEITSMKYKIIYDVKFEAYNNYVQIKELQTSSLSEEDSKHINNTK